MPIRVRVNERLGLVGSPLHRPLFGASADSCQQPVDSSLVVRGVDVINPVSGTVGEERGGVVLEVSTVGHVVERIRRPWERRGSPVDRRPPGTNMRVCGDAPDCPERRSSISRNETSMRLADLQQLIRDRYHATDAARGVPGTFLWFSEEIGELAEALGHRERGDGDDANLREEFADVLAWLTTLANVCDIDLEQAVREKYLDGGGPSGTK
jgi:NTP pyrophosphatase (non-canonical NTP hydrolase)